MDEHQINILPCLQEKAAAREYVIGVGIGKENYPGHYDNETHLVNKIDMKEFKSRWLGVGATQISDEKITKNGALNIPRCLNKYECSNSKSNRKKIWTDLLNEIVKSQKNIFLFSSHTMRMVNNLLLTKNCNYYNNCACVRIHIKVNPREIQENGRLIEKDIEVTQSVIYEGDSKKKKKNCNFTKLNDLLLEDILKDMRKKKLLPPSTEFNIFVIRHGNGIHNKPFNYKDWDSSLTPLGVYEAYKLGLFLAKYDLGLNNLNINNLGDIYSEDLYLGSSLLRRTQHTILGVLMGIYGNRGVGEKLSKLYDQLNMETITRCLPFIDFMPSVRRRGVGGLNNSNSFSNQNLISPEREVSRSRSRKSSVFQSVQSENKNIEVVKEILRKMGEVDENGDVNPEMLEPFRIGVGKKNKRKVKPTTGKGKGKGKGKRKGKKTHKKRK